MECLFNLALFGAMVASSDVKPAPRSLLSRKGKKKIAKTLGSKLYTLPPNERDIPMHHFTISSSDELFIEDR